MLEDEYGDKWKYVLCYLHRGWDCDKFSNDLEELDKFARDMIANNSGKPLIIVNSRGEVVREYAPKLRW